MSEAETNKNKPEKIDLTKLPVEDVCKLHDETIEQTIQQTGTKMLLNAQQIKLLIQQNASPDKLEALVDKLIATAKHNNNLILKLRCVIQNPEEAPINRRWSEDGTLKKEEDVFWLGEIPPDQT